MSQTQRSPFWGFVDFKDNRRVEYDPLGKREDDDGQEFLQQASRPLRRKFWLYFPWALSLLFFGIALFEAIVIDGPCHFSNTTPDKESFESGFSTDFVSARSHILVKQTTFTGGPAFDDQGNIYVPHPAPVVYVGDPNKHPEIDKNWERATWGRYVLITEDEARATWKDNYRQYWDEQRGGYVAGFDMFHTLHCVNNLRKTLWPEYYATSLNETSPANAKHHMDHCIDQIRQYIMCSGDMTPIGTKYYSGLGRNYVDSDVAHTCRDFDKLRDWMVDRYDGTGSVKAVKKNDA